MDTSSRGSAVAAWTLHICAAVDGGEICEIRAQPTESFFFFLGGGLFGWAGVWVCFCFVLFSVWSFFLQLLVFWCVCVYFFGGFDVCVCVCMTCVFFFSRFWAIGCFLFECLLFGCVLGFVSPRFWWGWGRLARMMFGFVFSKLLKELDEALGRKVKPQAGPEDLVYFLFSNRVLRYPISLTHSQLKLWRSRILKCCQATVVHEYVSAAKSLFVDLAGRNWLNHWSLALL